MASLNYQKLAATLFYAIRGKNMSVADYDALGNRLEKGELSAVDYINFLLASSTGGAPLVKAVDFYTLIKIYQNIYGEKTSPPSHINKIATEQGLASAVAQIAEDVLNYHGTDAEMIAAQNSFDQQLNTILYPSHSAANGPEGVSDILALYYLVGIDPVTNTVNTLGTLINSGAQTFEQVSAKFVNDRVALKTLSNDAFITLIFEKGYERAPTDAEWNAYTEFLNSGGDRGQLLVDVITGLRAEVNDGDKAAQGYFLHDTTPHAPGEMADLALQEQVASIYLAIPQRNVDAQGLDDWSTYLERHNKTFITLTKKLLGSVEFQKKGAQLNGNDFIQHVYTAVHNAPATDEQLAFYAQLSNDKALITAAIINDLRNAAAGDEITLSQQHAFEYDIGTSLAYKASAELSTTPGGGNATGTVNSGKSHALSNAETSVLVSAILDANAETAVDLTFADHLSQLTINGNAATTVNLSVNGVGVMITNHNENIILNAGAGDDVVFLGYPEANVANSNAQYHLGKGNDRLKWFGDSSGWPDVKISPTLHADGGEGVDIISANFFTKTLVTTGLNGVTQTMIVTNADQFVNFEKLDLTNYRGNTTATLNGEPVRIIGDNQYNLFDYGILTGQATANEISNAGIVTNTVPSPTFGHQGFVVGKGISSSNVRVINMVGGDMAQLEIIDKATVVGRFEFVFIKDSADKFTVNFNSTADSPVSNSTTAALSLVSSSSQQGGTALTHVNVISGGVGDVKNGLDLYLANSEVNTIDVSGDHYIRVSARGFAPDLTLIDASANTAGVSLSADKQTSGDSIAINFLKALPFTALAEETISAMALQNDDLKIIGTSQNDELTANTGNTVTGGAGADAFGVLNFFTTITDFNLHEDTLGTNLFRYYFHWRLNDKTVGTQVADYGYRTDDELQNLLSGFTVNSTLTDFFGKALDLQNPDKPLQYIGVVGTSVGSFVIVDHLDYTDEGRYVHNGVLDKLDTVVFLQGASYADIRQMYYETPEVVTSGIPAQEMALA
ncbi:hypothetical protein SM12BL3_41350 [Serratia marcescens]|nr:hypothetical protein SM12BL3_41350 [Serratia marcescens]